MNLADLRIETAPFNPKPGQQTVGIPRGLRVTHIETGLFVDSNGERSQRANLIKCIEELKTKLRERKENDTK